MTDLLIKIQSTNSIVHYLQITVNNYLIILGILNQIDYLCFL